jgi:hypothetical protein
MTEARVRVRVEWLIEIEFVSEVPVAVNVRPGLSEKGSQVALFELTVIGPEERLQIIGTEPSRFRRCLGVGQKRNQSSKVILHTRAKKEKSHS